MWTPTIGDGDQALNYITLLKYVQANAVLSGLDVTINTGTFDASDTLSVASGDVLVDGTDHSVSSTDVGITSATDFPRKDLVYVDDNGDVQVVEGQEAIDSDGDGVAVQPEGAVREATFDPSVPDLSGTVGTPIAEIWVDPDASSLQSADRTDRRPPGRIPLAVLEAIDADDLNFDPATQSELDSHADDPDRHHAKVSDSEVRSAVEGNSNVEDLVTEGDEGEVATAQSDGTLAMESPSSGSSVRSVYQSDASPIVNLALDDFWYHAQGLGDISYSNDRLRLFLEGTGSQIRDLARTGGGIFINDQSTLHIEHEVVSALTEGKIALFRYSQHSGVEYEGSGSDSFVATPILSRTTAPGSTYTTDWDVTGFTGLYMFAFGGGSRNSGGEDLDMYVDEVELQ